MHRARATVVEHRAMAMRSISDFMRDQTGIVLDPTKDHFIASRLDRVLRQHGFKALEELVPHLKQRYASPLQRAVIDALTVNETSFFRDSHPFDALRQTILPGLLRQRAEERTLNIWCAAASAGQEPYSLAMLLDDAFPQLRDWQLYFVATDINASILDHARTGLYSQSEINRGLPRRYRDRYFVRDQAHWSVQPALRNMIQFRQFNLNQPWPSMRDFDLILMRNVLIYFDEAHKGAITGRLATALRAGGVLMLGASEMPTDPSRLLTQRRAGPSRYYQRQADGQALQLKVHQHKK